MDREIAREHLARQSLRWDAGYCIVMGAVAAVLFAPLASALDAPKFLVALGGLATVAWGAFVARLAGASSWRNVTVLVVAANVAAAGALAAVGLIAEVEPAVRVVLLGVAVQVAGFAAIQAHALWSPFVR